MGQFCWEWHSTPKLMARPQQKPRSQSPCWPPVVLSISASRMRMRFDGFMGHRISPIGGLHRCTRRRRPHVCATSVPFSPRGPVPGRRDRPVPVPCPGPPDAPAAPRGGRPRTAAQGQAGPPRQNGGVRWGGGPVGCSGGSTLLHHIHSSHSHSITSFILNMMGSLCGSGF